MKNFLKIIFTLFIAMFILVLIYQINCSDDPADNDSNPLCGTWKLQYRDNDYITEYTYTFKSNKTFEYQKVKRDNDGLTYNTSTWGQNITTNYFSSTSTFNPFNTNRTTSQRTTSSTRNSNSSTTSTTVKDADTTVIKGTYEMSNGILTLNQDYNEFKDTENTTGTNPTDTNTTEETTSTPTTTADTNTNTWTVPGQTTGATTSSSPNPTYIEKNTIYCYR